MHASTARRITCRAAHIEDAVPQRDPCRLNELGEHHRLEQRAAIGGAEYRCPC